MGVPARREVLWRVRLQPSILRGVGGRGKRPGSEICGDVKTRSRVPVLIGLHQSQVCVRVVVGEDRGCLLRRYGQVAAGVAEVGRGGRRRVLDVLRVCHAVAVTVDAVPQPRARQELHRSDGTVPRRVTVPAAVIGVATAAKRVPSSAGPRIEVRCSSSNGRPTSEPDST
jgi:hypothetical protein